MKIILIGYRATGKTTLAALLVQRLNTWAESRFQSGSNGLNVPDVLNIPNVGPFDSCGLSVQRTSLSPRWTWLDTDQEVERLAGRTIAEIFADPACGEAAFRAMETTALREACSRDDCVIATGGGVPVRGENRQILRAAVTKSDNAAAKSADELGGGRAAADSSGLIVWLTATPETLDRRMCGDVTSGMRRPALTASGANDPLREIQNLLAVREPFYRQLADLELSTENDSPETLVEKIVHYVIRFS
ncbi:MAG: shikimate kinase [Thermoguttaceae bacterium]|nr:shikimate kinase [Thermoguttaceae bacterium]